MRAALRPLKRRALGALQAAGAFHILSRSSWRNRRLLILCYHGISLLDEHVQDPELFMRPSLLAARFDLLRQKGYTVLPLVEGVERLRVGTLPPRSVCLTFDDGMYNFAAAAQPLLERFGYPATVYLSTYYCIHDEPVFNPLVAYLLRKASGRVVDARASLGMDAVWDLRTGAGLGRAFWMVYHAAEQRGLDRVAKTAFARRIAEFLGVDFDPIIANRLFHLLRPNEVTSLARRGIDFQLHTHRHNSPLDRERFLGEIRENRLYMETMLGRSPKHFCYPAGVWRKEFLPWLRDIGVETAATGDAGLAEPGGDPLLLPRVTDNEGRSAIEFEAWLTGLLGWITRRRNGHAPA